MNLSSYPIRTLALLLSCLLVCGCTAAGFAALNAGKATRDYTVTSTAYGPEASQQLDIYRPTEAKEAKDASGASSRDVVFFLYGGRWEGGRKEDYAFVAAAFVKRGFVVVIPDYRKYPQVRFPTFVEDAAKALAWTDDHTLEYGGRAHRIHLLGHSAGAHIGALLAADRRYLAREGKRTNAVIADFAGLAGPYDFTTDEQDLIAIFGPPDRYPQMRATTFITGHEPPMLLLYGLRDDSVGAFNHENLAARIRQRGGRVEVKTYPTLGHIGLVTTFSRLGPKSAVAGDVARFFREKH